jgi:ParB family transcriptional regulator, chromosome partitioning protein
MAKINLDDMKKGLAGKGLGRDALFGRPIKENLDKKSEAGVEQPATPIIVVPALAEMLETAKIVANPFQPRKVFENEALMALSESLKLHGLIQPVTVRRLNQDAYQLISGERRWRAAQIAGLKTLPAYIRTADDTQMLEMAIIENIQREDLNPIEEALSYKALIDKCGLRQEDVAERVQKGRSSVTNLLGLLMLPPDMQDALKTKTMSIGHGKLLTGIKDLGLQFAVFKQIIDNELSVRDTEKLIAQYGEKKQNNAGTPPIPIKSSGHKVVQDTLSSFFGSQVDVKRDSAGKGLITIKFNSDADLNRILDAVEERK